MNSLFSLYPPSSATTSTASTLHAPDPPHPHAAVPAQPSRPFSRVCRALSDIGGLSLDQYLIRSFEDRDLNPLNVYGRQNLEISDSESEDERALGRGDNEGGDEHVDLKLPLIRDEDRNGEEETSLMVVVEDDVGAADLAGKDSLPDREESLMAEMEVADESETWMERTRILGLDDRPAVALTSSNPNPNVRMQGVERLHRTCQKAFGNSDALHFDFVEDNGPNSKQCILTITRPNGSVRSYKTDPVYTKKSDAKVQVTSIALERGALDFILNGDSEALKARKGELLAPLDASRVSDNSRREVDEQDTSGVNGAIAEIERCCLEWRAGLVKPFWVSFSDTKLGTRWGAAMRIRLTPNCYRVYSTDVIHPSSVRARISCAEAALAADVLTFIKYGNGQTQPAIASEADTPVDDTILNGSARNIIQYTHRKKSMSLQEYYESLPQPFPGVDGDKTAQDINAPAWLNTALQSSRGSKLRSNFHYFLDSTFGLHGCLLRIDRPGEVKSYLVDCMFVKRGDAKSAVCLLAMSSGVGEYIQQVKEDTDKKMIYDRRKANEIIHFLHTECTKIRAGLEPNFTFEKDRDAYGCSLEIDISTSSSTPNLHTYVSPPEFRSKGDAKAAVACIAAEQGVVELVWFKGKPPPDGYVPYKISKSLAYSVAGSRPGSKRKKADAEQKDDEVHEGSDNSGDENRKRLSAKKQKRAEAPAKRQERDRRERSSSLSHQLKPKAGFGSPQDGHHVGRNGRAGAGLIPTGPAKRSQNGRPWDFDASRAPIRPNPGPGYHQAQHQLAEHPAPHVRTSRLPPTAPRALRKQQQSPVAQPQLQPQTAGQYHQSFPLSHPHAYTQFSSPPPALQSPPTSTVPPHIHPAAWTAIIEAATQQQHHPHYSQPFQPYHEHPGYPAYSPPPPMASNAHQTHSYQTQYQSHTPDGMAYGAYMPPPPPPLPLTAPQYMELESYPYGQSHETRYTASYENHSIQESGRGVWPPEGVTKETRSPGPHVWNTKRGDLEEGELGEDERGQREQRDVPQYLDYGAESEGEEDMVTSSRGSTPAYESNQVKSMDSSSVKVPSSVVGMERHKIEGKGGGLGTVSVVGSGDGDTEVDRLREIVRRKRRKYS